MKPGLPAKTQALSIDANENDKPLIDVIRVLQPANGASADTTSAYLVGRMITDVTQREVLEFSLDFLDIHSQLITTRGLVIDENGVHESPEIGIDSDTLRRLQMEGSYQDVIQQDGAQIVRYFALVPRSPFIFSSQGTIDSVTSQVFRFFVQRGFAIILGLMALTAILVLLGTQLFVPPLRRITQAIQAMGRGDYSVSVPDIDRRDEFGDLAGSFATMRRQVVTLVTDLEERIEARVRDVTATREISHAAATQRDLQVLIDQVVNLLVERFDNIYHAQVFLIDGEGTYAVLSASTGEVGLLLLARGHRLEVGSASVVGRATESGEMTLTRDTASGTGHRRNEFLPDTRSELAIPLRIGERVIGALDVQSKLSATFSPEQMEVLQAMADQVALAIENARLYTESLRRLNEIERARQQSTLEAWHHYLNGLRTSQLESTVGSQPLNDPQEPLRDQALAQGQVVVGERTERDTIPLAVPIRLRGQLLGTVEWEVPEDEFDQNKVQLAQNLTDQLAVNLENARLFQESQRATQRERLVNEISSRLTSQNNIDQILQTAVREVGMALRSPQVSVRLNQTGAPSSTNGNGHSGQAIHEASESRSES